MAFKYSVAHKLFISSCIVNLLSFQIVQGLHIQNVLSEELKQEKSCHQSLKDNECRCAYRAGITSCCCVGENIKEIPVDLTDKVVYLFLYDTSIEFIGTDAFRNYLQLEKIHISASQSLKNINGSAFERLRNLRKIFISECNELTEITGTLLHRNEKLQSIIIRKNQKLQNLPEFEMNDRHKLPIDMLDLSYNGFTVIPTNRIQSVRAQSALFIGNQLELIESKAFENCQFIKLNFSDNPNLQKVMNDAFVGMINVNELDLSGSHITELPVQGLKKLQRLRLVKTPSLKKLPSVLAFNNLHTAEFTYPYHCCFFKYATVEFERGHDSEFSSHYREIQQRVCNRETTSIGKKFLRKKRDLEMSGFKLDAKNDSFDILSLINGWNDFNMSEIPIPDEEEMNPFDDNEVGKSVVIRKCVDTAVANFYLNISCTPEPDALNPCEDIVSYPMLRLFLWPMCLTALFGNISVWVIIAAVWQKRLRYHYFFMLNLSIADFLTGVYLAFLAVADFKTADQYYNYAVEWQTGWGCSVAGFINVFASELSIVSMLMIAVEIYYNARVAFYGKRMSSLVAYGIIAAGYVYAFIAAALPLFGVSSYEVSSICLPLSISSLTDQIYITFGLVTTAMAFAGMILNYVLINVMIRGQNALAKAEDKQILFRTLVLIGTDMACWLPTLFFGLTAAAGFPLITLTNAKICLILFYPINSCANPILYVFLTKIWKDAKKKAPFLEKISTTKDKTHSQQVNRFYYHNCSPAINNKEYRSPSSPDEELTRLLVTQTTSLNSTPRGSSSSAPMVRSTGDLAANNNLLGFEHRKSSRTSFQENLPEHHIFEKKRKSIPSIPIFRLRVSAIPEMSDISESSSNSAEDYERRARHKHKTSVTSRLVVDEHQRKSSKNDSIVNFPIDFHPFIQQQLDTDSGRGDSLKSSKNERFAFQPSSSNNSLLSDPNNHPRIFFTHVDDESSSHDETESNKTHTM